MWRWGVDGGGEVGREWSGTKLWTNASGVTRESKKKGVQDEKGGGGRKLV